MSEPITPKKQPLNTSTRESSQPATPVVTEKRSLAKPMLKRPNLSMRSKAFPCPNPQDTIPASPTGYIHIHNSQPEREQEDACSRSSTMHSASSTPKTPDLAMPPSEATTDLSRQSKRATSFCEVTCPEEPRTEDSPQILTPPHNPTDNKRGLATSTDTTRETPIARHKERDMVRIEDEKVVKKAKLNNTTSTPTSPASQSVSGPIPQVDLESVKPVELELELESESIQPAELEQDKQGEPVQLASTSPQATTLSGVTSLKRSSNFDKKSKPSQPTSNDCLPQEQPTVSPQMKLDRTPSQEAILNLDMKASQELSSPPCLSHEPFPVTHSKCFAPSSSLSETDENKEPGLATTNAFHSPIQSSSQPISSGKERKVESDSSPYRSDPPSGSLSLGSQTNNNLASILSSISRKRNLLKKHR